MNAEARIANMEVSQIVRDVGSDIKVYHIDETGTRRDVYGSIKGRTANPATGDIFKAFPITFNPTQYQLEKAGLNEKVDVIAMISENDFNAKGYAFEDVTRTYTGIDKIRWEVDLNGARYLIKDKSRVSQYSSSFLYINLGLSKKE